jgi:hypothetical protein
MNKVDSTVKKETLYIALFTFIFSLMLQSVYLILGRWDYTVLLGNLLGGAAATANFFIMGLTVQKALDKEEKDAKSLMKLSQSLRLFMLFAVALIGYLVPVFNMVAVVVPFLFPRIAVTLRALFIKKQSK